MSSKASRRRFCDTRLGQVHCITAGTDPRAPLVLLHQTPRSVDEFAEVLPLLARERRVVAVDTPGYGCSDPVQGQPSIEDYAGAILDVLDELALDTVIPVGHHTGAILAVELAAAAPGRVERVVLSGPMDIDRQMRDWLRPLFRQWTVQPDGAHLTEKWQKLLAWVSDPDLVQRLLVDHFRAHTRSEQGRFAAAEYRMEQRLRGVSGPALLIYGRRDTFATPARASLHRSSFAPVSEVTLDAGVFAPSEAPEMFAGVILDWLRKS